ncbi:MAG TPA: M1 family metallopeptidase [Cytophagales bacterium]|nr:M1 family metallopeptidase [Cytophagales bacterium]
MYFGKKLSFSRTYNAVFVEFTDSLKAGLEKEIQVFYHGKPKEPNRTIPQDGGFIWDKDNIGNPWIQVVCQGSGASIWWPNKDHLSDEPDSMKISVTVPDELMEISNGTLLRTTKLTGKRIKYDWYVSYPINNYNVTLNIGKYVSFNDSIGKEGDFGINYYVMPYNLTNAKKLFTQVKPLLSCYEKLYGEYPFKKDGLAIIETPYPMEHQSAVAIGKITDERAKSSKEFLNLNFDGNLVHEVAHEWWGNNVSCKDMADIWIHEAFATYSEAMFVECEYGYEISQQYLNEYKNKIKAKYPLVGVYNVNDFFYEIGDSYSKGSLFLNTLRHIIDNDSLWFEILKGLQIQFRYKTIDKNDVINYINKKSNLDLTPVFDQYLNYTSLPELLIKPIMENGVLNIEYKWNADVKDFNMPVKVSLSKGKTGFIYPTTSLKKIALENLNFKDFEVEEDEFLINVLFEE